MKNLLVMVNIKKNRINVIKNEIINICNKYNLTLRMK